MEAACSNYESEAMAMNAAITLTVRLRCCRRVDADIWSAGCPSLDLYSQGATREEASRCLHEAIELWFESCIERGVLHQALQELGFRTRPWRSPDGDLVKPAQPDDGDLLGERFDISVRIPAYQSFLHDESRMAA